MTPDEYCENKAAASGSSFYSSFRFLPPEQRRAITALYAFCREVDDVVDETRDPALARRTLDWWRAELAALYAGQATHPYCARWRRTSRRSTCRTTCWPKSSTAWKWTWTSPST